VAPNFLGFWLVRRTPTEAFYRIAYLLMALIAIALLWQGARGLICLTQNPSWAAANSARRRTHTTGSVATASPPNEYR
jgi:hypothetical protein